ncbi:MAG: ABC transporter permease [Lachnospiraceae bacterium]|nr:ABC transporter permease [Lachnospiraceae bacterium]
MLFKIAIKNLGKSIRDYAIYFFTLVIGVTIFYIFNALESQTVMLNVNDTTHEIIELMNTTLSGVSVFVAVVLGALIVYASRFLIKRRNKEFGIYLTLGMSKRKMSGILLIETVVVGILSLLVGLIIGVVISQFMSVLVADIFEADMSRYTFTFSKESFVKTCIYFGIMYVVVILFNTISIGKCKLIDLLYASKKSEKLKLKNPILCSIIFIISAVVLGYAYYQVTVNLYDMDASSDMIKVIVMGSVSTFFIFWSVSGMLLTIFTRIKSVYYRKLNSFVLRQFSSKANTMVFAMTIICLMLFLTICMLGTAFSLSQSMNKNIREMTPCDVNLEKKCNMTEDELEDYENREALLADSKVSIRETLQQNGFDVDDKLTDIVEVNTYEDDNFTMGDSMGDIINDMENYYTFIFAEQKEMIMKLSDYNKVAKAYGKETFTLKDDEYVLVADFASMVEVRNQVLKNGRNASIFGHELQSKYGECQDGFISISSNHINIGIFVVPDAVVDEGAVSTNMLIANYRADNEEDGDAIEKELQSMLKRMWTVDTLISMESRRYVTESTVGLGAMITFIGLYVGIVFLMASAAVLALKELSESADNVERFMILRKLGTDERMINGALFKQIGIFFLFPMLLAVIHSVFGLKMANLVLETFDTGSELGSSIVMTSLVIVLIYGGYFLVTYFTSRRMIKG